MAEKKKLKANQAFSPGTPFKDLLLADLMDWAIIIGLTLLVVWPVLFTWLPPLGNLGMGGFPVLLLPILELSIPFAFLLVMVALYDLLFERLRRGETPGKRIRGLRTLRRDGSAPALWAGVLHATLRLVGFIFSGSVGVLIGFFLFGIEGEEPRLRQFLASIFEVPLIFAVAALFCALLLALKTILRKGRRLGGVVVISEPRMEPEEVAEPDTADKPDPPDALITNIAEVSKNAKGIYFIYNGLLAFIALTVAGSSDRQIILSEPTTLPVINVNVSMDGFFILAPLLSIFFFIYFPIYFNKSMRLVQTLRSD